MANFADGLPEDEMDIPIPGAKGEVFPRAEQEERLLVESAAGPAPLAERAGADTGPEVGRAGDAEYQPELRARLERAGGDLGMTLREALRVLRRVEHCVEIIRLMQQRSSFDR